MPGRRLRSAALDLRPLRVSRDFRLLWCGQLVSMLGRQITVVAIPYQVYALTGSTLALGLLGLVQVVPLVLGALAGGTIADRVDRRRVLLITNGALAAGSVGLALMALQGSPPVALVLAVAGAIAAFGAVDQPARSATVPNLVPRDLVPSAVALMFGIFQVTLIAGPALGGLVIARFGLGPAYLIDVATFAASIAAVVAIAPQPPRGAGQERPLAALRSGFRHLRERPAILGGFAIDLDAMIFGMPRALFPVLADRTFHTGASGLGLLFAAPGVGAVAVILTAGWLGSARRLGRGVVVSVSVWGLAIALMGLTGRLWLALLLLAVAGGADGISALCRSTMMQLSTPDHLRGRTAAAYATVVMGGPYIGDLEGGAVGAAFSPAVSVVSGGVLCLAGVGVVLMAFPDLWRYDARTDSVPHQPDPGLPPPEALPAL